MSEKERRFVSHTRLLERSPLSVEIDLLKLTCIPYARTGTHRFESEPKFERKIKLSENEFIRLFYDASVV